MIPSKRGQEMDPNDPESHKNEGFLKSMWHNLTNHPAHQKPDGESEAKNTTSTDKKAGEKQESKDDESKKSSSG